MHIVVIGAGLAGTASAWYLRRQGYEVTVVDRADAAAMETSYANAGMLTPSMADPWNSPGTFGRLLGWLGDEKAPMLLRPAAIPSLAGWGVRFLMNSRSAPFRRNTLRNVRLANQSLARLKELRSELGIEYDQVEGGTLRACRDLAALDHASELAAALSDHGVEYRRLDRDGVVAAEPALEPVADKIVGGIHYQNDESGDAHRFCQGLATAAADAGVRFEYGVTVTGFHLEEASVRAARSGAAEIEAGAFVIAAGSYTPLLGRMLGVSVPVRPVKGYSITVPRGDWQGAPRIPVSDDHLHTAVTPMGDRIRVAGTAEFAGYDTSLRPSRIDNLLGLLEAIYPDFARRIDRTDVDPWCGFRPVSADGVPIIGKTPISNLYLNTGHGPLGWTMAAGSGELLASVVSRNPSPLDASDYALDRF
jgi:D-amino-acid dehydrogenase